MTNLVKNFSYISFYIKNIKNISFYIKNIILWQCFWYKTKYKESFLQDLSFWSVYHDFLTMISLFGLSFLLFVLKLSTGTKFIIIRTTLFENWKFT